MVSMCKLPWQEGKKVIEQGPTMMRNSSWHGCSSGRSSRIVVQEKTPRETPTVTPLATYARQNIFFEQKRVSYCSLQQ
jgi:hypothetical protein